MVANSMRRLRTVWVALTSLVVAFLAVFLDQWSKSWAIANLVEKESKPLVGDFFSLRLIFNSGAAFSLGENATWIFTVISAAVVVAVLWLLVTGKVQSFWIGIILGFIVGGAIGNLLDRLELIDRGLPKHGVGHGHVIDFLDYNGWFVGNVADIWVVLGVIFLAGYMLAVGDRPKEEDKGKEKLHKQSDSVSNNATHAGSTNVHEDTADATIDHEPHE
ncbi:signal peptidase II [Actinomycetaceae bacterium WB03_NA08]|uniref:Lipoprotein signal peptidase n=2 Tax=Scrofimicrobium canadense TaxID=2652290 RepID=A0A6N7VPI4_9ACTO|nr:signal peptidase II [Scrofimicrobium canadense]